MIKASTPIYTPSRVTQADFESVMRARRAEIFRVTARLSVELATPEDWADYFDAILYRGHVQASVLGRNLAGDLWPEGEIDQIRGLAAKDADAEFLSNFLDDIKTGRYTLEDGELNQKAIINRGDLYLKKMRATASEAFVDAGEPDEEYTWSLGANDHCLDCPRIAALSPFTPDTLFTHPGQGDTQCLGNCTCVLKRDRDSLAMFDRVDFAQAA